MTQDTQAHLEQIQNLSRVGIIILIPAGLLLFAFIGFYVWYAYQPAPGQLHCKDYATYHDILDAYAHGNRGLDGDGDGIPCENRK